MFFQRIEPDKDLNHLVECYWIIKNEDPQPVKEKIIPDGYAELIFHFGDPYRICINDKWEPQAKSLLAGQIDKYFFLENTGAADILGIKLKPTALTCLFNINMNEYTNYVADIRSLKSSHLDNLDFIIRQASTHEERIELANSFFKKSTADLAGKTNATLEQAVILIMEKKGMVSVAEACGAAGVGERQLENLFKKYVGLSPKLFARIIRFSYIFQLQQSHGDNWAGLAYEAAFFDQSHFIRNFKNFTGESPAAYLFDEKNMANFFLQKK